jgi:AraC-like DNA-binding protein/quercetin dioxygenase-like cupin family protein
MNKLLDDNITEMLLSPETWKLIATFLPEETKSFYDISAEKLNKKRINRHSQREILIPLAGEYCYGFDGKYYNCVPGTFFLIDSNIDHELQYTKKSVNLLHLWLSIDEDKVFGNCSKIHHGKIESQFIVIFRDFTQGTNLYKIWDMFQNAESESETAIVRRKMLLALGCLHLRIIENKIVPKSNLSEYQSEIIEAAKNRIQKNFKNNIDIGQLALMSGYSKFHFMRLFKEYAGITIHKYHNECRKNEVTTLLTKNYTMKEIAYELGFSCPQAFCSWRKKMNQINF